ncbi:MAG TPA: Crp/Fnr family transcriptional regulator [Oscillospiraceae bacterium]|nr:Crp/Fnr family transcriptional regulator [Oscillospiraceae bacterium]HPS34751.1 Crp/Fnr family transcriptional regulator [Oscillospiraceae bacterium]
MDLSEYFPIWEKLNTTEQNRLSEAAQKRFVRKGTLVYGGSADCIGLFLIRSGQLRAYILSDEGREITIYRLFERDICLFSASCMMSSIQFEISIEAEKDTELWVIPTNVYKNLMVNSVAIANYTNEIMAARFSEVMWLIEQIMWKSFDKRLAAFIIGESNLEESDVLKLTHEKIANHLGTAREVVTRMLNYFQSEDMITLTRGEIIIKDRKRLEVLSL